MSAWLHLRPDIMQEFYEQALLGRRLFSPEAWLYARELWTQDNHAEWYVEKRKLLEHTQRRRKRLAAYKRKAEVEGGGCPTCGLPVPLNSHGRIRRFCSKWCLQKLKDAERAAAVAARQKAKREAHPCPTCGGPITGGTIRKQYCSRTCRPSKRRPCSGMSRSEITRVGWQKRRTQTMTA